VSSADSFERRGFVAERDAAPVRAELPAAAAPLELERLFAQHYASVWRLLRRFGVRQAQLDDAAQEVFWVAARRLPEIRPGSETAFLYGVALRVASNTLRRERHAPAAVDDFDVALLHDTGPSPEDELDRRRRRALLDSVLDRMPLELRTVFVLFELEGLSGEEIARATGLRHATVRRRLHDARIAFEAYLVEEAA